jgi:purine-nucleoside phosphorylase
MNGEYDRLVGAREAVQARYAHDPEVALVLGSGLGALASEVEGAVRIPYGEIPGMPVPKVEGHDGTLVCGRLSGRRVMVFAGRAHWYEGHPIEDVVFGVRLARSCGAGIVLVTNAAGGINTDLRPGNLMIIRDHINLMGVNPLRGHNDERFGPRFPDMTQTYDRELRMLLREASAIEGVPLHSGVYAAVAGPSYETPAEIRMLRKVGADAVGMSTVPEVIAARHMGMRIVGLSCITNLAAGLGDAAALSHDEVKEVGRRAAGDMRRLVVRFLERLPGEVQR